MSVVKYNFQNANEPPSSTSTSITKLLPNLSKEQRNILIGYSLTSVALYAYYSQPSTSKKVKKYIKGVLLATTTSAIAGMYYYS